MKQYTFRNGDAIPALGLGTWKSEPGEVYDAVKTAVKAGYRHIDCAFIYLNEAEIGKALSELMAEGVVKREDLWITSKLWNNKHGRDNVEGALKNSLKDLQLDYIDLYLIHWPIILKPEAMYPGKGEDLVSLDNIPIAETWSGMEDCVDKGLAKHIGVSNFSVTKLKKLATTARIQPEMNQIEMHPFLQQPAMLEYCESAGIHLTAYSPLGSQDRIPAFKGENEPSLLENPEITAIAEEHQCSTAQVLIRWAIQRGTIVIPKSVNEGRIKQNYDAASLELSADAMQRIKNMDRHYRYLDGGIWAMPGSPYSIASLWDEIINGE